jgi:hypothetical protein
MSKTNNVVNFAEMVLTDGSVKEQHLEWLDKHVKSDMLAEALDYGATTFMAGSNKDPESFVLYLLELSRDRHLPTGPLYALVQNVNSQLRSRKKRQMRFTGAGLTPTELKKFGLDSSV